MRGKQFGCGSWATHAWARIQQQTIHHRRTGLELHHHGHPKGPRSSWGEQELFGAEEERERGEAKETQGGDPSREIRQPPVGRDKSPT